MFYTLMLALVLNSGQLDTFKSTKLICSDFKYAYERDGDSNIYIRNSDKDYAVKDAKSSDDVQKNITEQCRKSIYEK